MKQSRQEGLRRPGPPKSCIQNLRELYHRSPLRKGKSPSKDSKACAVGSQTGAARDDEDDNLGFSRDQTDRYNLSAILAEQFVNAGPHHAYAPTETGNSKSNSSHPSTLDQARLAPLPLATTDENAFLHGHPTTMMEEEQEEGRFHETPLVVEHGVAVLEESVQLGVPDIITQA